jgi:hypothetical protein
MRNGFLGIFIAGASDAATSGEPMIGYMPAMYEEGNVEMERGICNPTFLE